MEVQEKIWTEAMRSARQGDEAAYEWLLNDIAVVLRSVIARRLMRLRLNTAETEDIVQEILIGLHSKRFNWDETRPFMPWLYAIVRYKLIDAARRLGREARRHLDLKPHEWEAIFAAPHVDIDRATVNLDRHLTELSSSQRDVVRALAVEGVSVKVAAERFQQSEGTIRMTLHRALARLSSKAEISFGPSGGKEQ